MCDFVTCMLNDEGICDQLPNWSLYIYKEGSHDLTYENFLYFFYKFQYTKYLCDN